MTPFSLKQHARTLEQLKGARTTAYRAARATRDPKVVAALEEAHAAVIRALAVVESVAKSITKAAEVTGS